MSTRLRASLFRAAPALAIGGVLLLAPLGLGGYETGLLAKYFAYGIFAMSLALVWGQGGLLCFGQAVFFGIGAYTMSVTTLDMLPGIGAYGSTWLGLAGAIALPALFANLLGRFLFYGRGLQGAYFGIVTLAIAVIAERAAVNWKWIGGLNGLMNVPPLNLGLTGDGYEIWDAVPVYYVTLAVAALVYAGLQALIGSRYGTVIRAVRDAEERTGYFGYDTAGVKVAVFTLGAAVAGLAGALFVTQFYFASPPLIGFTLSTEVLIWVALGGRGYPLAAFLGAILVKYADASLFKYLGDYWLLGLGALCVLSVIWFPRGLIGEAIYRFEGWRAKQSQ
jgi:urea ABC transporter permease protein UrtC